MFDPVAFVADITNLSDCSCTCSCDSGAGAGGGAGGGGPKQQLPS